MREFLSRNGIAFEDRNVARDSGWRDELVARRGELVVPVLSLGDQEVVGFDEERIRKLLGLPEEQRAPEWDGLERPAESLAGLAGAPASLARDLQHLLGRIQREMEFNASKGSSPYRHGQHDGMRFARDGLRRILDGSYEPEDLVIERVGRRDG
ncbi:MAG TPA: glutaredoxin family protein [Candidatus Dormibacteraeota bacterium]|nr:glutaredoxin family protein [Candidatus Dormibacteraeota bacterium]